MDHRAYDSINAASAQIANLVIDRVRDRDGNHAPTILACAGFIAGEQLLSLCDQDLTSLTPGSMIENDWLTRQGNSLAELIIGWLKAQGVSAADPGVTIQALGKQLEPRVEPAQIAADLRHDLSLLFTSLDIGFEDRMLAVALAAVRLTLGLRQAIAPSIGAAIVLDALLIGGQRIPLPHRNCALPPSLSFIGRDDRPPAGDGSSRPH